MVIINRLTRHLATWQGVTNVATPPTAERQRSNYVMLKRDREAITWQDVYRIAGEASISHQTVIRWRDDPTSVHEHSRTRIEGACEKLGIGVATRRPARRRSFRA